MVLLLSAIRYTLACSSQQSCLFAPFKSSEGAQARCSLMLTCKQEAGSKEDVCPIECLCRLAKSHITFSLPSITWGVSSLQPRHFALRPGAPTPTCDFACYCALPMNRYNRHTNYHQRLHFSTLPVTADVSRRQESRKG